MKTVISVALVLGLTGLPLCAQTDQSIKAEVIGPSGDVDFPLEVQSNNGITYFCREASNLRDGVAVRSCRRATIEAGTPVRAVTLQTIGALSVLLLGAALSSASSTN